MLSTPLRLALLSATAALASPVALAAEGTGPFAWLSHPATNVAFFAMAGFLAIVWYAGGFKTIMSGLDSRAEKIRTQLDEAKDLREAAVKMLADAERRQRQAEEDAEAIVKQAKEEAKVMRAEAKEALAQRLARREAIAEDRIRQAETEATTAVRRAAADAATRAAAAILADGDASAQFDRAISEIESSLN